MSVSSVGSSSPNAYLQRLLRPDDADPSDGAAPSDPLQALFQAITGGKSSAPKNPKIAAAASDDGSSATCGAPQFSPDMMKALLSVQGNQGKSPGKLEAVLGKFDTDGDSMIAQSEFETAIGPDADKAKVDELFKRLDGNGDGAVGQDELKAAVQRARGHRHHHSAQGAGQQGGGDPFQALLLGSAADGTKVAMTTSAAASPAAAASANPQAPNFANLLKQLISLQAQFAAPTMSLSI